MKRSHALAALLVLSVAVAIFATNKPSKSAQSNRPPTPQVKPLPEHVAYWFLFRHVSALKRRADEIEKQGGKTSLRSEIKREAGLTDEQSAALEEVSFACMQEVEQKNAKAREIIEAVRARYPNGHVPQGERLPPPPAELNALQQERDAIILRARDKVRALMGEQAFLRFDDFVKKRQSEARQAANDSQ